MTPILVASVFTRGIEAERYERMARVLSMSAAEHCGAWDRRITAWRPPALVSAMRNASHVANTHKMEHWAEVVRTADDGACLLLMDADTFIVSPLDELWSRSFDFAYTTKVCRYPFNTGVVAVRVSPAIRAFFENWRSEQQRMLSDAKFHHDWRRKYGGINQASLGYLLEQDGLAGLRVLELPCLEWNCEDSSWASFDATVTRIVHVKSHLRRLVFGESRTSVPALNQIVSRWHDVERRALAEQPV